MGLMQSLIAAVYPPQCLGCGTVVATPGMLCPTCWSETPFITGLSCTLCGAPLPGEDPGEPVTCDDCLSHARPWVQGSAALVYAGGARRLVMALKHGDREDLAPPLGGWLTAKLSSMDIPSNTLVVPVPLHRLRFFTRRYNQAALLAEHVANQLALNYCPDALLRHRSTPAQKARTVTERFENVAEAFITHPKHRDLLDRRPILLIDDVMTSGATLAACADALLSVGAGPVRIGILARAVKDP